eukprot:jgi/Mesen1/7061/ME000369S06384
MATRQAVPAHIAENARRQGNRGVLLEQVRSQFKKNMHETDPEKIQEQKSAAVRGLSNFMFFEAARMATAAKGTGEP